jgi:hypothetical protein
MAMAQMYGFICEILYNNFQYELSALNPKRASHSRIWVCYAKCDLLSTISQQFMVQCPPIRGRCIFAENAKCAELLDTLVRGMQRR